MDNSTTVTCPADGCEYSGVPKSVAAHYSGSQNDVHKGGYQVAIQKLEAMDSSTDTTDTESDTGSVSQSSGSGDGLGIPSTESAQEPSQEPETETDMHDLPCGHESFDLADAPEPPFAVSCDTCGKSWGVTE